MGLQNRDLNIELQRFLQRFHLYRGFQFNGLREKVCFMTVQGEVVHLVLIDQLDKDGLLDLRRFVGMWLNNDYRRVEIQDLDTRLGIHELQDCLAGCRVEFVTE